MYRKFVVYLVAKPFWVEEVEPLEKSLKVTWRLGAVTQGYELMLAVLSITRKYVR